MFFVRKYQLVKLENFHENASVFIKLSSQNILKPTRELQQPQDDAWSCPMEKEETKEIFVTVVDAGCFPGEKKRENYGITLSCGC